MKHARQSGFTLVEMLLTSLVLAIGLIAIFSLFPVAAAMSRASRDSQRTRAFADSVFAAIEWQAAGGAGDVALQMPTEIGPRQILISSNEVPWPFSLQEVGLMDVPRLNYTLGLTTNGNGSVSAALTVRVQGSPLNQVRHYEKTFLPPREAW